MDFWNTWAGVGDREKIGCDLDTVEFDDWAGPYFYRKGNEREK